MMAAHAICPIDNLLIALFSSDARKQSFNASLNLTCMSASSPHCVSYCLVDMWGDSWMWLPNRKSSNLNFSKLIQLFSASRVWSVISNWTGRWVFCCMMMAREAMWPPCEISLTLSFTKSHARSLLSMARLNSASSRMRSPNWSRTRIAQMSFSLSGTFCPMS